MGATNGVLLFVSRGAASDGQEKDRSLVNKIRLRRMGSGICFENSHSAERNVPHGLRENPNSSANNVLII